MFSTTVSNEKNCCHFQFALLINKPSSDVFSSYFSADPYNDWKQNDNNTGAEPEGRLEAQASVYFHLSLT